MKLWVGVTDGDWYKRFWRDLARAGGGRLATWRTGAMKRDEAFTPEAARRWEAVPARTQALLLNNVWCSHCGDSTTIVHYGGRVERGVLVLEGRCLRCDGPVARVIEQGR